MVNLNYYMGVDIAKSKVDIAIINEQYQVVVTAEVSNSFSSLQKWLSSFVKQHNQHQLSLTVCAEHTGVYNRPLELVCLALGLTLWEENPIKIKRASQDFRGKSDQKDAVMIAEYCLRYKDRLRAYEEPSEQVRNLKHLFSIREDLLLQQSQLTNRLKACQTHDKEKFKLTKKNFAPILKSLSKQLKEVDNDIKQALESVDEIKTNVSLLTSIPGVGIQTALAFVIYTNNFKLINEGKRLACFAGVVPFPNQSGTIRKKDRVSKHANMILKRIIHLAAMSVCKTKGELGEYYRRKIAEGKNKMSVLNALRNKLIQRMCAVINRQEPYQLILSK